MRRTEGGDGPIPGGSARGSEEIDSEGGFSLGSNDDGRLLTPMITENDSLNVDKNPLINISVNPNVLNSCESIPEVPASESETEVLDLKDRVSERSQSFNPEVSGS